MLPKVVIVGRPNVGKSSLLNLLAGRRISIVDPVAGITRDRVSATVQLGPADHDASGPGQVELIDTGGYGIDDVDDLTAQIQQQIGFGIAEAQLILMVIDARQGVVALDRQVAQLLRSTAATRPIVLVANKVDSEAHEPAAWEATSLGMGLPVPVSATSGYGKADLVAAIRERVDQEPAGPVEEGILLAIVGKRNAGKSSLVNALAGQQRLIVSQREGTTRDAVDVQLDFQGRRLTLIDTAGIRKHKSLNSDVAFYSHHRALRSIRRCDVVALVVDAAVPVSQVDAQLSTLILRSFKPCVVVVNKWDLAESNHSSEQYAGYLDKALKGLDFAPLVLTSAVGGEGLKELVEVVEDLYRQSSQRVTTATLNRTIGQLLAQSVPRSKLGRQAKVYYAAQIAVHPPTIAMFVNHPSMFDPAYQRFLVNRLRNLLPFGEVPIRLLIRSSHRVSVEGPVQITGPSVQQPA